MASSPLIPVFVINFNRLRWPQAMLPHIHRLGGVPIVLDQASTYPPLLAWYDERPCDVLRLGKNLGPRGVWKHPAVAKVGTSFVVTDPDLDLAGVPDDALDVMAAGLERHPRVDKIGLSLRLDDLPPRAPVTAYVLHHETKYWSRQHPDGFYDAAVDTTFALYRPSAAKAFGFSACRTPPPYAARHLPWYEDPASPNDEDLYYLRAADRTHASLAPTLDTLLPSALQPPVLSDLRAMESAAREGPRFLVALAPGTPSPCHAARVFLARHPGWAVRDRSPTYLTLQRKP